MRRYIIYSLLSCMLFGLFSCREIKKPNDLKNCVVLYKVKSDCNPNCNYIRYMNLNDSTEHSYDVSEYWSDKWNIGDTIK